jgi:hypothetical protein
MIAAKAMRTDRDSKREKRSKILIGIFIAAVMILSTFGFVMEFSTTSGQSERVKGIKFDISGQTGSQAVVATVNNNVLYFSFFPSQAAAISMDKGVADLLRSSPTFYVTSSPTDTYAKNIDDVSYYLTANMPKAKDVYPVPAFTNATGYARPGVTCQNATAAFPVVHIFRGNTTEITLHDNCVEMSAYAPQDVYRLSDRLMFLLLGVTDG